jgi:hypothetical protein
VAVPEWLDEVTWRLRGDDISFVFNLQISSDRKLFRRDFPAVSGDQTLYPKVLGPSGNFYGVGFSRKGL